MVGQSCGDTAAIFIVVHGTVEIQTVNLRIAKSPFPLFLSTKTTNTRSSGDRPRRCRMGLALSGFGSAAPHRVVWAEERRPGSCFKAAIKLLRDLQAACLSSASSLVSVT